MRSVERRQKREESAQAGCKKSRSVDVSQHIHNQCYVDVNFIFLHKYTIELRILKGIFVFIFVHSYDIIVYVLTYLL